METPYDVPEGHEEPAAVYQVHASPADRWRAFQEALEEGAVEDIVRTANEILEWDRSTAAAAAALAVLTEIYRQDAEQDHHP